MSGIYKYLSPNCKFEKLKVDEQLTAEFNQHLNQEIGKIIDLNKKHNLGYDDDGPMGLRGIDLWARNIQDIRDHINPRGITFVNPRQPERKNTGMEIRGYAEGTKVNGQNCFNWLPNEKHGYFSNFTIIKNGESVVYQITENNPIDKNNPQAKYKSETYYLKTDPKNNSSFEIVCTSGNRTNVRYPDPLTGIFPSGIEVRKPIIAFRFGGKKAKVSVKVNFKAKKGKGKYKVIYPLTTITEENDLIWQGEVQTNDLILVENNGQNNSRSQKVPYLFWDGETDLIQDFDLETGFCVHRDEIFDFLEEKCALFGFDEVLTTDFITFWSPYLLENDYNLIRFLTDQECEKLATLEITCEEKLQIIRMYMLYRPSSKWVEIPAQKLEKIVLSSLAKVFDWGGFCG
jgi:hypothetical protein